MCNREIVVYVDGRFNKKYTYKTSHSAYYKDDINIRKVKNTVNKYMADIRLDRLMTCQSEWKSVVSRRPSVQGNPRSKVVV
jgi:hypothetical protein